MLQVKADKDKLADQLFEAARVLTDLGREVLRQDKLSPEFCDIESVQVHLDSGIVSFLTEVKVKHND